MFFRLLLDFHRILSSYRIKNLEKKRSLIMKEILSFRSMIPGAFKIVYCKCGKENCWCYQKKGHPFRRITWTENGLSKTKAIPQKDVDWIKEVTGNYRKFRKKPDFSRRAIPA